MDFCRPVEFASGTDAGSNVPSEHPSIRQGMNYGTVVMNRGSLPRRVCQNAGICHRHTTHLESAMTDQDRTLQTSRTLPFTPKTVYGAFESPDLLASWWGPDGFANTFEVFDFKVGGRWKFVMHGPDGQAYPNDSVFSALEPASLVVIRHDCAPYFTLTVRLAAADAGTHLTWEQVFDEAQTAQAVKHIVEPANEQNINRLTRVLTQQEAA